MGLPQHSDQQTLAVLAALSYRTGELSSYLAEVAQGISQLVGLDWSVVTFCKDDCERVLASTIELGEAANQVYSLHGSLTGTVVQTGCPLVVEDATTCTLYGEAPEGYRAYLGVPLRTPGGEVIGTICSFQRFPRHFTPEEVRLAELFAERAATAIDNYTLYQYQQQVNAQLQAEIRERQEAEQALRDSEEQLRQITENLEQVFWMYSRDGQPIYLSPAFATIWGRSCQAWYEDPTIWWQAIHPDDQARVQTAFDRDPVTFEEEYRILRPDGRVRLIRDQAFPVRNQSGEVYRIAGIAEDITERKQAEQEMVKAIAALAEVGELAAMIVHEVRNPLTTVLMGLNSMKRLELPESLQERLNLSLEEAERIRTLLAEILLYAKPQALHLDPIELNTFIRDILEPMRTMPSALTRRIELIPATEPVTVLADKDKLKQVFINLIDNACQAIATGEVVTWSIKPDTLRHQVEICIHNGGEPIPPEILPKLSKPFYTTKSTGTGLGLAIVKRILEAHSGELTLTSTATEGTVVTVRLAIAPTS